MKIISVVGARPNFMKIAPFIHEMLRLNVDAKIMFTDSGGLQEETSALNIRCITIRNNTERPITIDQGTNQLAGTTMSGILAAFEGIEYKEDPPAIPYWDGGTSDRIIHKLRNVI